VKEYHARRAAEYDATSWDVPTLPFPDGGFDLAFSSNV